MTYILSSLASQFRSVVTMSTGYAIAIMSTMLMYILLPIILTDLRGEARAWLAIMLMTVCQIFFFGPLAASYADRYGARRSMYGYALFFIIAAVWWLLSGVVEGVWVSVFITIMMLFFAAGYSCKMVEAYILRVNPAGSSGIAFGFVMTLSGLGRFVATLIQPYLVDQSYPRAAWIMIGAMVIFALFLRQSQDDGALLPPEDQKKAIKTNNTPWRSTLSQTLVKSYKHAFSHGARFVRRCRYFPLIPLSFSLWEGIFFGSLWFIVPLYLAQHPEYFSHGWEIGIYEVISIFIAVACGYLVDKRQTWRIVRLGWLMIIVAGGWMIASPQIETMIGVGVIIALASNMLFSAGQHILAAHDRDHADDGAYSQMKQFVLNIGFMLMPLLWWYMHLSGNDQFAILGYINIILAVVSLLIALYLHYRHSSLIKYFLATKQKLTQMVTYKR